MSAVDYILIAVYFLGMIGVGLYFMRRQTSADEYFVGNRQMSPSHIGMSVVATDVGGGFSIGLGGLGFAIGLSGSWLLFTGLIGAWVSAVLLIPRIKPLGDRHGWLTFPQLLEHRYDTRTRLLAAIVSGIGYAAFVGAQILAGAKLGAVAFHIDQTTAVLLMAFVIVLYTSFGGLEAVVYTDTIQWIVLLVGLVGFALPFAWVEVGGWHHIRTALPAGHLSLLHVAPMQVVTWLVTIVPIWFVGNTLYQRIYASRDVESARRAWYIAGLLEWPLMAFVGTALGVLASVMFPHAEPELGMPMLIRDVLPAGVVGIVLAAYFSAIMSTADSCLLASVGHFVTDIYQRHIDPQASEARILRLSRILTFVVGGASVAVALLLPKVLDAIMLAYAFMVSGLFVPTVAALAWKRATPAGAFWSMLAGGGTAVVLNAFPVFRDSLGGVNPVIVALPVSALVMVLVSLSTEPAGALDPVPSGASDAVGRE